MHPIKKGLAAVAATLCLTTVGVLPATTPAAHADACADPKTDTLTTTEGITVWIPSSRTAGPFQWGGNQTITTSQGELNATTKGHTNTVGGTGGLNIGVVKAEAKYEHQWQKSTTVTNSFTQTFSTNSGQVSRNLHWRWRMYHRGHMFIAKRVQTFPVPCLVTKRVARERVVVPSAKRIYSFDIETYGTRGWLHNNAGDPFKP